MGIHGEDILKLTKQIASCKKDEELQELEEQMDFYVEVDQLLDNLEESWKDCDLLAA